jgi:RNA 2',3'-cyclic 3'-phosphodiesterase
MIAPGGAGKPRPTPDPPSADPIPNSGADPDRPATWRCFVALPVPRAVANVLELRLAGVRAAHPSVRWLGGDDLHLTLVFIGALPPGRVSGLERALEVVAAATEPFSIELGEAGAFGGRGRSSVAWLGVRGGQARCIELAGRVLAVCRAAGAVPPLGDRAADPPFRPHVTVARRSVPGLPGTIDDVLATRRLAWRADVLVLYRSHLGPPAARYEPVVRVPLGRDLPPGGGRG